MQLENLLHWTWPPTHRVERGRLEEGGDTLGDGGVLTFMVCVSQRDPLLRRVEKC